jgi:streptomycin 6-kinase
MRSDNGTLRNVNVEHRLRACIRRWDLRPAGRLAGGFRSEIVACTLGDGTEVVLKLTPTAPEARAEAAALTAWSGTGVAVRLIDSDLRLSALLLERIRPGTHLPSGDGPEVTDVAADLLSRLHAAPMPAFPFPSVLNTYTLMEQVARDDAAYERKARGNPELGQPGVERLPAARAAVLRLCTTTGHRALLHGDFLDKNLLSTGSGHLAIDPTPHIGDPCADVGFFAAGHAPATGILARAVTIAERMELDPDRARRWAAVWTVLQTCQGWRDDQDDLERAVSSPEFDDLLHP